MSNDKYVNIDAADPKEVNRGIIDILLKKILEEKDVNSGELVDFLLSKCAKNDDNLNRLRKMLEELNPENNSEFEHQLTDIVDGVDIFQGTIDLGELSRQSKKEKGDVNKINTHNSNSDDKQGNPNINSGNSNDRSTEATQKAGIDYVRGRIEHYLLGLGLAKNVLVEYSLLSSTLEPTNPDKLQCISFMRGDDDFIDKIGKYYKSCIDQTEIDHGLSIYQHPRFLYDIDFKSTKDQYDKTNGAWADKLGVTGTFKTKGSSLPQLESITPAGKSIYKEVGGNHIHVAAFELDRSFNEMLLKAKVTDPYNKKTMLVEIQNTLHSYCHENISGNNKDSVYVAFPIYGSRASNQLPKYEIKRKHDNIVALQGIGAFFIYFEPLVDLSKPSYQQFIKVVMNKIAYEMGNFIRLVSANYMFNLGLQLQEKARKEALKSARSAIMSRNMSHNLGSHVMSYLKQSLSSVQRILDDRLLSLLFEDNADMLRNIKDDLYNKIKDEKDEKGALPFLVGLGRFISYLQERQDFIATIATDFIPYLSTVNFKDFIYDELNPDKRYQRHKDRKNYKTDNILLGNIARSEGLGRPTSPTITLCRQGDKSKEESKLNDIIIKFRSFDGNPVKDPNGNITNKTGYDDLYHMRDYDLSLPGGVVGRQAIFSIVENIIRNAAKHGNWREAGGLELSFDIFTKDELLAYKEIKIKGDDIKDKKKRGYDVKELEDELEKKKEILNNKHHGIESALNDNENNNMLSLWNVFKSFYMDSKDSNDLFFITLTDNLTMDEKKLEKLRKAINEPLINERCEMNEASKGIKEMRISSTWLRGLNEGDYYNPLEFDKKDNTKLLLEKDWKSIGDGQNAPALYARISNNNLQYIFCVLRPKRVAIVSSKFPKEEECLSKYDLNKLYNSDAFLRNSWSAFHPEDYIKLKNKSYEFVVYDEPENKEDSYWYDLRYVSSSRLLKLKDIPLLNTNLFAYITMTFDNRKNEKNFYHGMLCSLYCHIAGCDDKLGKAFILIDDKKTFGRLDASRNISDSGDNRDEISDGFNPFSGITIIDGQINHEGVDTAEGTWNIYRTHHDSAEEFVKYMEEQDGKHFKHGVYVEGITGNNSTDRLIRNESLDEEWFYRHMHAMKEKVAIFDERLFTKIFGLEEADLIKTDIQDIDIRPLRNKYFADHSLLSFQQQRDWQSEHQSDWKEIILNEYQDELSQGSYVVESLLSANAKTDYIPTTYSQKGIFIFTIIRDPKHSSKFNLYGIERTKIDDVNVDILIKENGKYISVCKKIAVFSWDDSGLNVEWLDDAKQFYHNIFSYISIHQGLLDKLYTVFDIKDKPDQKEKLTKLFFEEFSSRKFDIVEVKEQIKDESGEVRIVEVEDDNEKKTNGLSIIDKDKSFYLLPGMCIHSGRSKPSEDDMPQRLPFIQYASIENAVSDCKYSMIELLDFARYE